MKLHYPHSEILPLSLTDSLSRYLWLSEKMALTNIGYDVVGHAVSTEEAVKKTVELEPDLILMRAIILEQESIISN